MTDFNEVVSDQRGWLEWLTGKIPGYSGYKEKEMRREADTILRQKLALELQAQLTRAEGVGTQMLTGPGIAQLSQMGTANTRLQTLVDKVKTAAQGYAGFFDAVRVKEDELDNLYEFDYQMLSAVETLGKTVDGIQAALDEGGNLAAAVRGYTAAVDTLNATFDQRRTRMVELA